MLKPAANNELFQEGFNRSANDPEWKSAIERGFDAKRSYVQDKALDLTGETDFRRRQTPH